MPDFVRAIPAYDANQCQGASNDSLNRVFDNANPRADASSLIGFGGTTVQAFNIAPIGSSFFTLKLDLLDAAAQFSAFVAASFNTQFAVGAAAFDFAALAPGSRILAVSLSQKVNQTVTSLPVNTTVAYAGAGNAVQAATWQWNPACGESGDNMIWFPTAFWQGVGSSCSGFYIPLIAGIAQVPFGGGVSVTPAALMSLLGATGADLIATIYTAGSDAVQAIRHGLPDYIAQTVTRKVATGMMSAINYNNDRIAKAQEAIVGVDPARQQAVYNAALNGYTSAGQLSREGLVRQQGLIPTVVDLGKGG